MASRRSASRKAVTVVELVALTGVGGLLLTIAFPAVRAQRAEARRVQCAETLHGFANGLGSYTNENGDWMPGVNTTGVQVREKKFLWYADPDVLNDPDMPVQSWDWMLPVIRSTHSLPDSRAERFNFLLNHFRCPQQRADALLYLYGAPDLDDFEALEDWPAVSYLSPAYFHYWGTNNAAAELGVYEPSGLPFGPEMVSPSWEVTNEYYTSAITHVGPPSRKIFVADGTRYVAQGGIVDIDVAPDPGFFGAFTSPGAWSSCSTAYGVETWSQTWGDHSVAYGSASEGQNLRYSYRHVRPEEAVQPNRDPRTAQDNTGGINAAFFDGHVERLYDRESREISLWYPTGSIVQYPDYGMTDVPAGYVIP